MSAESSYFQPEVSIATWTGDVDQPAMPSAAELRDMEVIEELPVGAEFVGGYLINSTDEEVDVYYDSSRKILVRMSKAKKG